MDYDDAFKERFHSGIDKNTESGCWLWKRSCFKFGYGQIKYKYKNLKTHRVSYELFKGEIPEGKIVCHKCNIPQCCNPDHLYAGTHKDNYLDTVEAGTAYFHNLDQDGERNISSVLNAEKCSKILEMFKTNKYTHQDLADIFLSSRRVIGRLLDGTTTYNQKPLTVNNYYENFLGVRITKKGVFTILSMYNSKIPEQNIAEVLGKDRSFTRRIFRGERNVKWVEEYYRIYPTHLKYKKHNRNVGTIKEDSNLEY